MTPLETALVILVSIWSIIFIVIGIAMVVLVMQVKKALDKINHIVDNAESVTQELRTSLNSIVVGLTALTAKGLVNTVVRGVSRFSNSKKKK